MTFRLVTDRDRSFAAFRTYESSFCRGARAYRKRVGFRPQSVELDVFWHEDRRIWGTFVEQPPSQKDGRRDHNARFWILFGVQHPGDTPILHIAVETNPPHEGINRFVHGAFVTDSEGQVYITHSGKLGGGSRLQSRKQEILDHNLKDWPRVYIAGLERRRYLLGDVGDPGIVDVLADYVRRVADARHAEVGLAT